MSKLNTFDVVSLKTHREIVQDMRNDADILRTQLDETLATNAAIAERAAKLESQIEATHRAIDSIGLSRCADSHESRDANGCVTCDDGKPPLSLAERTEWLIRWLSDDPYPMGPRIKALEAENAALKAERDAARQSRARLVRLVRELRDWRTLAYKYHRICLKAESERDASRESRKRLVGLVRHLRAWFSATAPDSAFVKRITDERDQYITQYTQVKQVAEDARLEISALNEMIDDLTTDLAAARAWASIWKRAAKGHRQNAERLDCEAEAINEMRNESRAWAAAWKRGAKWWRDYGAAWWLHHGSSNRTKATASFRTISRMRRPLNRAMGLNRIGPNEESDAARRAVEAAEAQERR